MPGLFRKPDVIIFSGPNGAGKTTFARPMLETRSVPTPLYNADDEARTLRGLDRSLAESTVARRAGEHVLEMIDARAVLRLDFAVETTLAGQLYKRRIGSWQLLGFAVTLHYLRLPNVEMSIERVRHRVASGGHDIPEPTLRRRFPRSVANLDHHLSIVDQWYVHDWAGDRYRVTSSGAKP